LIRADYCAVPVITLLYELRRRKKKYGLATACIGGGRGLPGLWKA
jgi:acetyl-CoA acetyltransferase